MIKNLSIKTFPLTRDINNSSYILLEFFVLLENLSKYKFSGYLEIKGSKYNFIILIDEGIPVSYVDITNEPFEISPLIFKYRIEEEIKVITYTMPIGFSNILRGFYIFENQIMNNTINNYRDWEALLLKISKKNITGIIQIDALGKEYFLLVKSGNIFLRTDMINNNNLIVSSYFYNEVIIEKIKNNTKINVNVIGIDNKELEEHLKQNDIKHSLVREMEIKESRGVIGASIIISPEIIENWIYTLQTNQLKLKIEGLEEKFLEKSRIEIKKDPKLPTDVIFLPSSVISKIKIRDRKVVPGEKIVIYPEIP